MPLPSTAESDIFDLAPVSLWLEDYSGLRAIFAELRAAGVTDLRAHLREDLTRVARCSAAIRLVAVNRRTLELYEAESLSALTANLGAVLRDDTLAHHLDELGALWDGEGGFASHTVNYTLGGRRLDIQLRARIMPGAEATWERVLVSVEDVTRREEALRRLAVSEDYARGLFEQSPVSLWVEDFSAVKRLMDEVRRRGIADFRTFVDVHPEFVQQCIAEIHVLDVNRHTLSLFAARDKAMLLGRLDEVFRGGMVGEFKEQLVELWAGRLVQQREVTNYTLDGAELHLHMQFSVLPGHEADWSLVQVALTDITARKKAEAYLEFLGRHDVLTKTYNRSFFNEEIARLERKRVSPVSILVADLNGLKAANDTLGHAAGDKLLARAGEVLNQTVEAPRSATRVGGDEFALILPDADEREAIQVRDMLLHLVELNNQYHAEPRLSFAVGIATHRPGERLEDAVRRADEAMYVEKRAFYAARSGNRRRA